MSERCPRLRDSFLNSPVVDINGYPYFINPISDGIPRMDKELLNEVADALIAECSFDCDVILTPEAMGIPLAVAVSERTGVPFAVIRKRMYGLPGEIRLDQTTGYSSSPMYINGICAGDRVAVIDDVISTGGTTRSIVHALKSSGAVVTEVAAVFSKTDSIDALSSELGVPVRFLLMVSSKNGKPMIL